MSAKKCLPCLMTEFPEGSFYMRQREAVKNGTCCAAGFPLAKGSFLPLCTGQKSFTKSPGLSEQKWQTLCPPTLQLLFIDGIPFTSAPQASKDESLSSPSFVFFCCSYLLLRRSRSPSIPGILRTMQIKKGGAHPCLMMMTERIGGKSRSITYGK